MAVFQLPTDGIADGAITTAKINASVSLGASVNVILDGTDGGGSNAGDNVIIEDGGTDDSGTNANAGDKMLYEYYTSFTNSQLLIKDAAGNVLKAIYGVGGKL